MDTARAAEAAGAGAVWTVDHLFWRRPILECLTSLAVVAAATSTTVIGSCVLQLPLRSASAVAKQAASLQLLSDGRLVLGVGAGSHQAEYELAGSDFATRGRRLDAGIAELRRAWATGDESEATYRIAPLGDPVPVWVGGSSPAARRRAATHGDGWIPLFLSTQELADNYRRLDDEALACTRDPAAIARSVVVPVAVGDGPDTASQGCGWLADLYGIPPKAFERHLVAGSVQACAEQIAGYMAVGAQHVTLFVASSAPIEQFASLAAALAAGGGTTDQTPDRAELAGVGA